MGSITKKPIIFHPNYNFKWRFGEYDRKKSENVKKLLIANGIMQQDQFMRPEVVSVNDLRIAHTDAYLESLKDKKTLAAIFQNESLAKWYMPNCIGQHAYLTPVKHHVGGTLLAGQEALKHGWAINLGGGCHHASREIGSGFCALADISLSIHKIKQENPDVKNIMIIDLDAHQGNGHERDFLNDANVYTIDFYTYMGEDFYPNDEIAMAKINIDEKLEPHTKDTEYLIKLRSAFNRSAQEFKPDLIYYVAGTDILEGDPYGLQSITEKGIIQRDEIVFAYALNKSIPIVMTFGGGYQKNNAQLIANSIQNLDKKFGLLQP